MEKTDNPLIRQIMEIIRNDSVQHHRVQQFIIDSLTKEAVKLTPEELAQVWDEITAHDEVERETIELAKQLKEECRVLRAARAAGLPDHRRGEARPSSPVARGLQEEPLSVRLARRRDAGG